MVFRPDVGQRLPIDGRELRIAEHPAAIGMPYSQEGRAGIVYMLEGPDSAVALKVFKPRFRDPSLVALASRLAPYASLLGLTACQRSVLDPEQHYELVHSEPDLTYAALMPWIQGPTWTDILLEQRPISETESLTVARGLLHVLRGMEKRGLAHCDLSGPNILIPALDPKTSGRSRSAVELVDVEQLYGPDLQRPRDALAGTPGYAARLRAGGETWGPAGDRFAGALLVGEMLGWCDERVRASADGDTYFKPGDVQQFDNSAYRLLAEVIGERWSPRLTALLERAWNSDRLIDCPTFADWSDALDLTIEERSRAEVRRLISVADELVEQQQLAPAIAVFRQAEVAAGPHESLRSEIVAMITDLERLSAEQQSRAEQTRIAAARRQRTLAKAVGGGVVGLLAVGLVGQQLLTAAGSPTPVATETPALLVVDAAADTATAPTISAPPPPTELVKPTPTIAAVATDVPTAPPRPTATATPAFTPTPLATPTPSVDDLWQLTLKDVNDSWSTDWPKTITTLDAFLTAHPDFSDAKDKLYAAHVFYAGELLDNGDSDAAVAELEAAQAVSPDRPEAQQTLTALTPTPTPTPTVRIAVAPARAPTRIQIPTSGGNGAGGAGGAVNPPAVRSDGPPPTPTKPPILR